MHRIELSVAALLFSVSACSSPQASSVVPSAAVGAQSKAMRTSTAPSSTIHIAEYNAPDLVKGLAIATDGDPYFGTANGLERYEGGQFQAFPFPEPASSPVSTFGVVVGARNGAVWSYGFDSPYGTAGTDDGYIFGLKASGSYSTTQVDTSWAMNGGVEEAINGPDGRIWCAAYYQNQTVDRQEGTISAINPVTLAVQSADPFFGNKYVMVSQAITIGPDGAVWVYAENSDASHPLPSLYRFADDMKVTNIVRIKAPVRIAHIVTGPDHNLWFTDYANDAVGKVSSSGIVTEYKLPTPNAFPNHIVAGNDGAVWFTETQASKIGRVTTAGQIAEYPTPTGNASPWDIANAGATNALWFTETSVFQANVHALGKLTY